ncbi:hypothetical protein ACVIM8_005415 [Bradyrhizobium sp. USDA 4529]
MDDIAARFGARFRRSLRAHFAPAVHAPDDQAFEMPPSITHPIGS